MPITKRDRNFVHAVGGDVYFAPERTDGTNEGERDFGDTPGLAVAVETETFEAFDSDGLTRQKVISNVTQVTRTATLSVRDVNKENLALFIGGDAETISQTLNAAVSGESVDSANALVADRSYQLGVSTGQPMGVRAITTLVVKSDAGGTTHVLGTDYEADLELGRIRVIPGGGLDGEAAVTVDYSRPAKTIESVAAGDTVGVYGSLRLISKNASGDQRDFFAPRVRLAPSGEFAWKSVDAQQEMSFSLEILEPSDGRAAIYVNGRAA